MAPRAAFVLLCVVGFTGGAAGADVVRTKDGLTLEGAVTTGADGTVSVATNTGVVRLPAARVASIEAGEGPASLLRRQLAALPPGDVEARFRLALRADAAGWPDVAREAYEAVVALSPDHPAARRALGQERVEGAWVTTAEANRRRGLVLFGGRWLLPVEAEAAARAQTAQVVRDANVVDRMRTAATADAPLAQAAALDLARTEAPVRVTVATALLRDPDPAVRGWACGHLASVGDEVALRPLIFSAVRDPDPAVRAAAVAAAASFGHDDVAIPFVRALGSEHPGIVANAARALAGLGDVRAIHAIVRRTGHGESPRVSIESLTQVSYVRDYDVEIAQLSNIANPVIGVAQEGIVFDVKVIDAAIETTTVDTILLDAFNTLAHAQVKDVGGMLDWYRRHATTIPEFPARPASRRSPATTPSSTTR